MIVVQPLTNVEVSSILQDEIMDKSRFKKAKHITKKRSEQCSSYNIMIRLNSESQHTCLTNDERVTFLEGGLGY